MTRTTLSYLAFALLAACTETQQQHDPSNPGDGKSDTPDSSTETRAMIGRCSHDSGPGAVSGAFRAGSAIANFYRATTDAGDSRLVVAHGVAFAPGTIVHQLDTINIKDRGPMNIDQGSLWPVYDVVVKSTMPVLSGEWIDNIARQIDPDDPLRTTFSYQGPLGTVKSATGVRSIVQDLVVGSPSIYPFCVFWELP